MDIFQGIDLLSQANEATQLLKQRLPHELQEPAVGIICGSGLGCLAEAVLPEHSAAISYSEIPHFPINTGNIVCG